METLDALVAASPAVGPAGPGTYRDGDSDCGALSTLSGAGVAGDGASGDPGKSYSEALDCVWVVEGPLVEVRFTRFRVWAGDAVKVYGGDAATGPLLGVLSGLDVAWPPFRYPGKVTVVFETDGVADGAGKGCDVGQLQRLLSRSVSTRFG